MGVCIVCLRFIAHNGLNATDAHNKGLFFGLFCRNNNAGVFFMLCQIIRHLRQTSRSECHNSTIFKHSLDQVFAYKETPVKCDKDPQIY